MCDLCEEPLMRVRLAAAVVALAGLSAPAAVLAVPAQAATCTSPNVVGVEAAPTTVVVGPTKEARVEIYLGVEANGCKVTKPTARLDSLTGGSGRFAMDKLDTSQGITTYGVLVGLSPKELYLDDAGRWDVAAQVTWSGGVAGGEAKVKVVRAARLTVNASPEPVKKGKTLTITGALTRANWNTRTYAGYSGQKAKLQYRPKNSSTYATLKTITTTSTGKLSTTVKATADGDYRYTFAGTSTTATKTSSADCIDVR